jgi:hypothetical protein
MKRFASVRLMELAQSYNTSLIILRVYGLSPATATDIGVAKMTTTQQEKLAFSNWQYFP